MPLIREINTNDNTINYLGTIVFFCAISCSIIMLRFKGFKATLNLLSGKIYDKDSYDKSAQGDPICGAYRISNEEFMYDSGLPQPPKKIAPSPSMVHLPKSQKEAKPFRSTNDLTSTSNESTNVQTRTPNTSQEPKLNDKNQIKEKKRLEKQQAEQKKREKQAAQQQQAEQKKREKLAAKQQVEQKKREKIAVQENKKQEKLKKEREKQGQISVQTERTKSKQPAPQTQKGKAPNTSQSPPYSTNTLESSISRSSGPPPYSPHVDVIPNSGDNTGNTSFAKSTEDSSWDMISQHRHQMNKQVAVKGGSKQTQIDLKYSLGISSTSQEKDNSEV